MKNFFDGIVKIVGLLAIAYLAYLLVDYISKNHALVLDNFFFYFGRAAFILATLFLIIRITYGKNWISESAKSFILGGDLISAIDKTLVELPTPSRPTIAALGGHILYRFTRIALVGLLLAVIPIVLLWQQNEKLDIQNRKIDVQNDRINIQNNLIEAERRSSLVFLMSNIFDKVDDEIKEQQWKIDQINNLGISRDSIPDHLKFSLSRPLIGRIVALSKAFVPYRSLDGKKLSEQVLSPERGQLFIALAKSNLDSFTQNTILSEGDFSSAMVGQIDLSGANLSRAYFFDADLGAANLSGANLSGACLSWADLAETDLTDADLRKTILYEADISWADLSKANLSEADLSGANLSITNLSGANLLGVNLSGANLLGVNLSGANLLGINLSGADFSGVNLSGAIVDSTIWIQNLEKSGVKGVQEIKDRYYVDQTPVTEMGETYYLIRRKVD